MNRTVAHLLAQKGPDVWTIAPDATVFHALELMADNNVGALVVVDQGRLAGIISERDYIRKGVLHDRRSSETLVRQIMTEDLHTVTRHQTIGGCMALMTNERIRHLPVVEDDALLGLVSIGDVVKALIADQESMIEQLERYITG
jgi:CBS domain-containing protein